MIDAHLAVELGDLVLLHRLLRVGADVNEEQGGLTLLHHAVDVEADSHAQTGELLTCDMTALLLRWGADPLRISHGGTGVSALHMAFSNGHHLAVKLFESHRDPSRGETSLQ